MKSMGGTYHPCTRRSIILDEAFFSRAAVLCGGGRPPHISSQKKLACEK
jgi:hypothetical protein